MAWGSRWCSRKERINVWPTKGVSSVPQVSDNQWTTPEKKSARSIAITDEQIKTQKFFRAYQVQRRYRERVNKIVKAVTQKVSTLRLPGVYFPASTTAFFLRCSRDSSRVIFGSVSSEDETGVLGFKEEEGVFLAGEGSIGLVIAMGYESKTKGRGGPPKDVKSYGST